MEDEWLALLGTPSQPRQSGTQQQQRTIVAPVVQQPITQQIPPVVQQATVSVNDMIRNILIKTPIQRHPEVFESVKQLQTRVINEATFNQRIQLLMTSNTQSELKRSIEVNETMNKRLRTDTPNSQWARQPMQDQQRLGFNAGISMPSAAPQRSEVAKNRKQIEPVDVTKLDVDSMMDVTNYAGFDLAEEEYQLDDNAEDNRSHFTDKPLLNIAGLQKRVEEIAKPLGITSIDPRYHLMLSHAVDSYLRSLMAVMKNVSQHRAGITLAEFINAERGLLHGSDTELTVRPLDDIRNKLSDMEMQQRDDEEGIASKIAHLMPNPEDEEEEATEQQNGGNEAIADGNDQTDKKKAKKPASKRDLPEAVKNKLTNKTAFLAAGGKMKSWMIGSSSDAALGSRSKRVVVSKPTTTESNQSSGPIENKAIEPTAGSTSAMIRASKRIMLRDAIYALEQQQSLRSSPLLIKWLANIK